MKLIYLILLSLAIFSCSKEDENKIPTDTDTFKNSKIISYSKNMGHSGEEITIYGENFTSEISKITLTFDNISATILSSSLTEIKFILPRVITTIPVLNLVIPNRSVTNEVVNEYNGNIGILPAIVYNSWSILNQSLIASTDIRINKIQHLSATKMYLTLYSGTGGILKYTDDGGIKWKKTDDNWANLSAFHMASNSNSGFNSNGIDLRKITNFTSIQSLRQLPFISTIYVDDNLDKGTVITNKGIVYITNDGVNFNQVYQSSITNNTSFDPFSFPVNEKLSNNHIWAGGRNKIRVNSIDKYYPFLLFKNNTTDGWKEYSFQNDLDYVPCDIVFLNQTQGYLHSYQYDFASIQNRVASKIYKTSTGGDSWSLIYNGLPFLHLTFKDVNIGWAITANKIYKTIDAGVTWQLNYTHTQDLRNISYKDGVVWAFSKDNILKFYLQ